jgi:hypothetical protein
VPLDGSYDSAALLLDLKSADLATCKYISSIACCRTYSKGNAYGAKGKKRRISHVALFMVSMCQIHGSLTAAQSAG